MKRKMIFALSLVACLILFTQGCGSSEPSYEETAEDDETYEEYESTNEYDPQEETAEEGEQYEDQNDIEGLILANAKTEQNGIGMIKEITISSLNISSGLQQEISKFEINVDTQEFFYAFPGKNGYFSDYHPNDEGYYATHSEYFSNDYKKMAVTARSQENGETHAGWIDTDGNFFDVTDSLGLHAGGDFSIKPDCSAGGFYENYFVYNISEENGPHTFCVPINNIVPEAIEDRDPFPFFTSFTSGWEGKCNATDWVNDSIFIINKGRNSVLYDMESEEITEYIPESSRTNWNGVLSPDGTQIAFMSEPSGTSNTDIYTVPLSGGEPSKVPTTLPLSFKVDEDWVLSVSQPNYPNCLMLIDWK